MNVINFLNFETSLFGYRINVGSAVATTATLAIVTAFALKKLYKSYTPENEQPRNEATAKRKVEVLDPPKDESILESKEHKKTTPLLPAKSQEISEERFWSKVEETSIKLSGEGPVVLEGQEIFPSLAVAKRECALSCTKGSEYVNTYFIQSAQIRTALDLGCGMGTNSIPLLQRGWTITAIDKLPEAISLYNLHVLTTLGTNMPVRTNPKTLVEDIVTYPYPENVDAVICVDVLPYVPSIHLKNTLRKIYKALKPGGQFIGTLFIRPTGPLPRKDQLVIELLSKLGAHYYPGKEFAHEIIARSGFIIKAERERNDGPSKALCVEFLAEKPS